MTITSYAMPLSKTVQFAANTAPRFSGLSDSGNVNQAIDDASRTFSSQMASAMMDEATKTNTVICPASSFNILSMLYLGANKETRQEIAKAIGLKALDETGIPKDKVVDGLKEYLRQATQLMDETGITLNQGFGIWAKKEEWTKDFLRRMQSLDAEKGPLTSADKINNWASEKTGGKIKDVISEEDVSNPNTRALAASFAYLKSAWRKKFDKDKTEPAEFYGLKGTTKPETMYVKSKFVAANSDDNKYQAISLPYGKRTQDGNELKMTVFMPAENVPLKELYQKLFGKNGVIQTDIQQLQDVPSRDIKLHMPKYLAESNTDTKEVFSKLGVQQAFGLGADFTDMLSDTDDVYVGKMNQKAFLDVNEEGTEGGGFDTAQFVSKGISMSPPPEEININRPFISVVHDDKGHILFVSTVTDLPNAKPKTS